MRFVINTNPESELRGNVYVRQSWLNDLVLCPERARFKLVKPEMSGPTDATIMGTAVHYGIETYLLAKDDSLDGSVVTEAALQKFKELQHEPYRETNLNPEKYEDHIVSMSTAWFDEIRPHVELGGDVEFRFSTPLGISVDGWSIWIEGTMDYVEPSGVVWDWKTASRAYNAREKQSTSIQASVYTEALRHLGRTAYPATFKYGVMIRGDKPKAQILEVSRTSGHRNWLANTARSAVAMACAMTTDNSWPTNDTSVLCSERWCPYWSICKGAYLSPTDLSVVTNV